MINKTKGSIGRIYYDRSFLLALRLSPLSLIKPCTCEDYEVILKEPIIQDNSRIQRSSELSEDYFSHVQTKHVITGISLQNDQKLLHVSEKPWKPAHKDPQNNEHNKNLESAVLYIMNRLTPSNFKKLADEMMALEIKSYEDLELVVSTVFDKVAMEPKFVQAYASLCKVMLGLQVEPPPTIPKNKATFRAVLVTKCQRAFEADKSFIFEDPEETKRKVMEDMKEDTPARAEKIEAALYQMKLNQLKFFGNISFIGELFKLGILPEVIIHSCITRLLSCNDEESLFSLCKLVTGVGKNIDTRNAKTQVDKYFARIAQLADASKSRLKFALRDVLDLRKNKWVPRNKAAGPKTIAEIHKDFKVEKSVTEVFVSKPKKSVRFDTREAPLRENRPAATVSKQSINCDAQKKDDRTKLTNDSDKENEESWSEVKSKGKSAKSNKKKNNTHKEVKKVQEVTKPIPVLKNFDVIPKVSEDFTVPKNLKFHSTEETDCSDPSVLASNNNEHNIEALDVTRFKLTKSKTEDDIVLAPGGRSVFSSILGRFGQAKSRDADKSSCEKKIVNRFSLLLDVSDEEGSDADLDSTADAVKPVFTQHKATPAESHNFEVVNKLMNELPESESLHCADKVCVPENEKPIMTLSEEELESKSQNLIDEYISCRDIKEVFLCVRELKANADLGGLVTNTVNYVLEKTDAIRQLISDLFSQLLQADLLTVDNIIKGFSEVMAIAEDIVVDVPKLWTYLAQLISPLLGNSLPWTSLATIISPLMSSDNSVLMLAHIFKTLRDKQTNITDMQEGWKKSGLQWETFLEIDRVIIFLAEHKIKDIFVSSLEESMHQPENNNREDSGSVIVAEYDLNKCDSSNNVHLLNTSTDSGKSLGMSDVNHIRLHLNTPDISPEISSDPDIKLQSDNPYLSSENSNTTDIKLDSVLPCVSSEIPDDKDFKLHYSSLDVSTEISNDAVISLESDFPCNILHVSSETSNTTDIKLKSSFSCDSSEMCNDTDIRLQSDAPCVSSEMLNDTESTESAFSCSYDMSNDSEITESAFSYSSEMSDDTDIKLAIPCESFELPANADFTLESDIPCMTSGMLHETDVRVESYSLQSDASSTDDHRNPDHLHLHSYEAYPSESLDGETNNEIPILLSENVQIHNDHEGEEVWRKEMEVDEAGFYTHISILNDSEKKVVCCVPFKLDKEEENYTFTNTLVSKVNDLNEEFLAPHVIEVNLSKNVVDGCVPNKEFSVDSEEQVPHEEFLKNSSQTSTLDETSTKEFQTDVVDVQSYPWSTVYIDVDRTDDAVSSSEEEILISDEDNFDDYFKSNGGLYTPEDHQRYLKWLESVKEKKDFDFKSNGGLYTCVDHQRYLKWSESMKRKKDFDDFKSNGGLYTPEDHQRYLKRSESMKGKRDLSTEAPCFFPQSKEYGQIYSEHTAPFVTKQLDSGYKTEHFYYNSDLWLSRNESAGFIDSSQNIPHGHVPVFTAGNKEENSTFDSFTATRSNRCGQTNPFEFLVDDSKNSAIHPNSDMVRFLVQCQQAAFIVESMLRNKSSNQDILKFMQEKIIGTDIERALLAIFTTALAYYSLHDASGNVVRERKEIIQFLLCNDQSREVEAVQILHLVLCHLSNPQGIAVLLQALFSEKLVSIDSLKKLFYALHYYIRDNGIKSDSQRQKRIATQDQNVHYNVH